MGDQWRAPHIYDQSIIVYSLHNGGVYGGSDPTRKVKQVEYESDGWFFPGGDFTMELDLSNRSFVMEVDKTKIIIDTKIGDFKYSPIVMLQGSSPEVTLV